MNELLEVVDEQLSSCCLNQNDVEQLPDGTIIYDAHRVQDWSSLLDERFVLGINEQTLPIISDLKAKNIIYLNNELNLQQIEYVLERVPAGVRIELAANLSKEQLNLIASLLRADMVISPHENTESDLLKQFVTSIPRDVLLLGKFTDVSVLSCLKSHSRFSLHPNLSLEAIYQILPHLPYKVILSFYNDSLLPHLANIFRLIPAFTGLQFGAELASEFLFESIEHFGQFHIFMPSANMTKETITQVVSRMSKNTIFCPYAHTSLDELNEILDELPGGVYYHPNFEMSNTYIQQSFSWWDYRIYLDSSLLTADKLVLAKYVQEHSVVFCASNIEASTIIELAKQLKPGVIFQAHHKMPFYSLCLALQHLSPNVIFQAPEDDTAKISHLQVVLSHLNHGAIFMPGNMQWSLLKQQIKGLPFGSKLMFNPYMPRRELLHYLGLVKPGLCVMIHPNTPAFHVFGIFSGQLPFLKFSFYGEHPIQFEDLLLCCANLSRHTALELPQWLDLPHSIELVQALPRYTSLVVSKSYSLQEHIELIRHIKPFTTYHLEQRPQADISDMLFVLPKDVKFAPQFELTATEISCLQMGRTLVLPELDELSLKKMASCIPAGVILEFDDKISFEKMKSVLAVCASYVVFKSSMLILNRDLRELCHYFPERLVFMTNECFSMNQLRTVLSELSVKIPLLINRQQNLSFLDKIKSIPKHLMIEQEDMNDNMRRVWYKKSGHLFFAEQQAGIYQSIALKP